jgi:hypothetical protein
MLQMVFKKVQCVTNIKIYVKHYVIVISEVCDKMEE